jgi:hypothetical protein
VRKKTSTRGEEDEGRSRQSRVSTKLPTPQLAAVEAAEQALDLGFGGVGAGVLGLGVGARRHRRWRRPEGEVRERAGAAVNRRKWRLEEGGEARQRSCRRPRVAAVGRWADGRGGGTRERRKSGSEISSKEKWQRDGEDGGRRKKKGWWPADPLGHARL